jgi:hypothetical protein
VKRTSLLLALAFVVVAGAFVALRRFESRPRETSAPPGPATPAATTPRTSVRDAAIEGRVVDRNGAPIAAAQLALRSADGVVAEKVHTTDADGRFATSAVPAGRYTVLVWARNGPEDEARIGLLASNTAESIEAGARDVEVVLPPAARTRGVVQDASGNPLERAHVLGKSARGVAQSTTVTGAGGEFELVLPLDEDNTLEVRVPQPPGARPLEPVVVGGVRGGARDVVVRVSP